MNDQLATSLRHRIKETFAAIENEYDWLAKKYTPNTEEDPEGCLELMYGETIDSISYKLNILNNSLALYLEAIDCIKYFDRYQNAISRCNASGNGSLSFSYSHETDSFYATFPTTIREFLVPLGVFEMSDQQEIDILENILRSTGKIIHDEKIKKHNEADIYNAVRKYISASFPLTKGASNEFTKIFKVYKPDILVPEVSSAIEYKLADSEGRLKQIIDELHVDVINYTGNTNYSNFFAVIFMTSNFLSEPRCNAVWLEKKFPSSWKAIFVIQGEPKM